MKTNKTYEITIMTKSVMDAGKSSDYGDAYIQEGQNPADAITRFVTDPGFATIEAEYADKGDPIATIECLDNDPDGDGIVATASNDPDGSWALEIQTEDFDVCRITLPATRYMSVAEAAEALDVNRQRVHQLIKSGKLSARKVGGSWTVSEASVRYRISEGAKAGRPRTRYYYAQWCPYGSRTASLGDRLVRFVDKADRDEWVNDRWYDGDQRATELTRDEAERWYPAAFRPGAAWLTSDECDELAGNVGVRSGELCDMAPTGGLYTDMI
jgi:excisionase family DNA binding protein